MESIDDNELTLNQQIFNLQLDLENQLKSLNCGDNEVDSDIRQTLVYQYLDNILDNKLQTVDDFGNDIEWLNVETSISLNRHLNGLVVLMDFFTYCCINCLHILPVLKQIESDFECQPVVVIGVHSPKFDNEKDVRNVCNAVLKYNIDHPIANDPLGRVWTDFSVQCWPTVVILGPNSQLLFTLIGENGVQEWIHFYTEITVKYFKEKDLLINENKSKIPLKLIRNTFDSKLLGFPSKVNVSEDQQLIAISNPKYHNIIIATNNGIIKHIIGGNESGLRDGSFTTARFNGPNGVVWKDNRFVFVADTENHCIRRIDLNNENVITLAGNGIQTDDRVGGKIGCNQGLNSPWDVCVDLNNRLFIAMAGSHQIWVLTLEDEVLVLGKMYPKNCCLVFAGDGNEQNRNNRYPHKASFAQPSGLTFDPKNNCLFIADSESSSVRCVDITNGSVSGVVGGDRNPVNLFAFGDLDGKGMDCRLQHCMAIAFDSINGSLFVADSYNHKIKEINISSKECISIAGIGTKGNRSECKLFESVFNEPNGLCLLDNSQNLLITDTNNHCLKLLDLSNDLVKELKLIQLNDKMKTNANNEVIIRKPDFTIALDSISFGPNSKLKLRFQLEFGEHIKTTEGAKQSIEFSNPDETLFSISAKQMKIEDFQQINEFSLVFNDRTHYEGLNKTYTFITSVTFNLCNNSLNSCKQIKVDFHLPLILCDNQSPTVFIVDLPFTYTSFH